MTDYKKKYIKYKLKYLHLVGGVPKGKLVRKKVEYFEGKKLSTQNQASQASTQQKSLDPSQASQLSQASTQQKSLDPSQASTPQIEEDIQLPKRYTRNIANQEIDFLFCFKKNLGSLDEEFIKLKTLDQFLEKQSYLRQQFTSAARDVCVSKKYTDSFISLLPETDKEKIISLRNSGRQDSKIIFFNSLEEISTLLYEISIIIDVFSVKPFNENTLVQQIKNKIMEFKSNFVLIGISNFVLYLSKFLYEYFELTIKLLVEVLGVKYDKISLIDLTNFKYIALKLEAGDFRENMFIVSFDSILLTITQAWAKLFTLIKLLIDILSKKKDEIIPIILTKANYQTILETLQNFDTKYSKVFNELQRVREERVRKESLRQPIIPMCDQILVLLSQTRCGQLQNMITSLKNNIGKIEKNNKELLDEFNSIINFFISSDFSCSNTKIKKIDVYNLLKQIGDKFIIMDSSKGKEIKKKFTEAYNSLQMSQRIQQATSRFTSPQKKIPVR